jgi:hypothetical protein
MFTIHFIIFDFRPFSHVCASKQGTIKNGELKDSNTNSF